MCQIYSLHISHIIFNKKMTEINVIFVSTKLLFSYFEWYIDSFIISLIVFDLEFKMIQRKWIKYISLLVSVKLLTSLCHFSTPKMFFTPSLDSEHSLKLHFSMKMWCEMFLYTIPYEMLLIYRDYCYNQ